MSFESNGSGGRPLPCAVTIQDCPLLALLVAAAKERRQAAAPAALFSPTVQRCDLCRDSVAEIAEALGPGAPPLQLQLHAYGARRFCYRCAKTVVAEAIVPSVAASVAAAVPNYGATLAALIKSTAAADTARSPPPVAWRCRRCGGRTPDDALDCKACGTARQWLICHRCGSDANAVEFCVPAAGGGGAAAAAASSSSSSLLSPNNAASGSPVTHDVWDCAHCGERSLGGEQCGACREWRAWYCGVCSMENTYPSRTCSACHGKKRVRTLGDFAAADELGIDPEQASRQRLEAELLDVGRSRLTQRLERLGLVSVPADDNGNCLFEALAFQLTRQKSLQAVVRLMTVDYVTDHADRFADILGADGAREFADDMTRDRAWGNEYALMSAANAFRADIHIITSIAGRWALHFKSDQATTRGEAAIMTKAGAKPIAVLAFVAQAHYSSAVLPPLTADERLVDLDGLLPRPRGAATAPGDASPTTPASNCSWPPSPVHYPPQLAAAGGGGSGSQPALAAGISGRFAAYQLPLRRRSGSVNMVLSPPSAAAERQRIVAPTPVTLRASGGRALRERRGRPELGPIADVWYAHPCPDSLLSSASCSPAAVAANGGRPPAAAKGRRVLLQHVKSGGLLCIAPRSPRDATVQVVLLPPDAACLTDCIVLENPDRTLAFVDSDGAAWHVAPVGVGSSMLQAQRALPPTALRFELCALFSTPQLLCTRCGDWWNPTAAPAAVVVATSASSSSSQPGSGSGFGAAQRCAHISTVVDTVTSRLRQ